MVKNPPAVQETHVQFLGQEDPLEKRMATHFSILALDRGVWRATVHGGHKELDMTETLTLSLFRKQFSPNPLLRMVLD